MTGAAPRDGLRTIGILGAGKVGTVLARLALTAGFRVLIAASREPERIALIVDVLAPGAEAVTAREAIEGSDAVILALPLGRYRSLDPALLAGRLVIDGMNYWPPIDGEIEEFERSTAGTSEHVRAWLPGARLVKSVSHLGYHQLDELARARGATDRVGLAVAGDDPEAVEDVAALVDALGFDPVRAGSLEQGRRFQAGTPVFGAPMPAARLAALLGVGEGGVDEGGVDEGGVDEAKLTVAAGENARESTASAGSPPAASGSLDA